MDTVRLKNIDKLVHQIQDNRLDPWMVGAKAPAVKHLVHFRRFVKFGMPEQ
jgi:hypothetical protein